MEGCTFIMPKRPMSKILECLFTGHEYESDANLLTEEGLSLTCKVCGHVRVIRGMLYRWMVFMYDEPIKINGMTYWAESGQLPKPSSKQNFKSQLS